MKLGKKGFTMVELLGVITIMGILMAIAVPSVIKYVDKARKTSMETMLKSTYEAAENYMMTNTEINISENGFIKDAIKVEDLVKDELLEPLNSPYGGGNCASSDSKISVYRLANTVGNLPNYVYDIKLVCKNNGKDTSKKRKLFPAELEIDYNYRGNILTLLSNKGLL